MEYRKKNNLHSFMRTHYVSSDEDERNPIKLKFFGKQES